MTKNSTKAIRVMSVLFEDRYGGPQKRVIQIAKILSNYGVKTILCLPEGRGNTADIAKEAGIEVQRVAFERIPRPQELEKVLVWVSFLLRDVWRFIRLFRRVQPEVVHINGAFFLAPALAAKLVKVPLVWHLNDTIAPVKIAAVLGSIVRLFATQIVTAAEAVTAHYRVAHVPHTIIYAPVDTTLYKVIGRIREHQTPRIGLIANWSPIKGVEYFVQAVALVREQIGNNLEIVFAGAKMTSHTDYCQYVDQLINKLGLCSCIHNYGFVPSSADILVGLDVLVLSSTTEACPMVVLEGMATGIPVVATDVGGVRELLLCDPLYPAGIVVPPKNPEAIASAILELLRNPDKATFMGQNGRRLAEECFSLEICAQKHLKIYTNLADRSVNKL